MPACLSRSRLRLPQGSHARHVARIVAPSIEHLLVELLRQQHLPTLRLLLIPVGGDGGDRTATAVAATATAVAVAATAEEGSDSGIVREAEVAAVAATVVAVVAEEVLAVAKSVLHPRVLQAYMAILATFTLAPSFCTITVLPSIDSNEKQGLVD